MGIGKAMRPSPLYNDIDATYDNPLYLDIGDGADDVMDDTDA